MPEPIRKFQSVPRNCANGGAAACPPLKWKRLSSLLVLCFFGFGFSPKSHALDFFFTALEGAEKLESIEGHSLTSVFRGLDEAGSRWSTAFTDDFTVRIEVKYADLGHGLLAETEFAYFNYTYLNTRNALLNDATTARDANAALNTPPGVSFPMLINLTSDNPWGAGSETHYIDYSGLNNSQIQMTSANAKALGLYAVPTIDATITINTRPYWDFNLNNGVDGGSYDFAGVVAHEIGHVMGFASGVDVLDGSDGSHPADYFRNATPLDLFRYSEFSAGIDLIDWSADGNPKFFSIDGGLNSLGEFATGSSHGDGFFAGHWKKEPGTLFEDGDFGVDGIMGAWIGAGEMLEFSAADFIALDVIGWDLNPFYHLPVENKVPVSGITVPDEASSVGLLGLGLAVVGMLRRRK